MPKFILWPTILCLAGAVLSPAPAAALPIFTHRYGLSCQQCHTTVPQLTAFGEAFRAGGFRLPGARGVAPVAVKVESAYTSAGETGLPKAVVDEVEVLSAGSLGRNTSYWLEQYVIDGGMPGRPRDAGVETHRSLGGTFVLQATLGEISLPLPLDPETQRPTLSNYALFDQSIGANNFTLFAPRIAADASVMRPASGAQAHLVFSAGDIMTTLEQPLAAEWRAYVYRYQGRRKLEPAPDRFYRQGYALGYVRGRLDALGITQRGNDTSAQGNGISVASGGNLVQAGWHFSSAFAIYARREMVFDTESGRRALGVLSLVMRPSRNMRFTLEGGRNDNQSSIATGLLFAY